MIHFFYPPGRGSGIIAICSCAGTRKESVVLVANLPSVLRTSEILSVVVVEQASVINPLHTHTQTQTHAQEHEDEQ